MSLILDWTSKPIYKRCFFKNCERKAETEICTRKCSRCKIARYCSRECQRADWGFHQKSCCNADFFTNEAMSQYAVCIRRKTLTVLASPFQYKGSFPFFRSRFETHGVPYAFPIKNMGVVERGPFIKDDAIYVRLFDENLESSPNFVTVPIKDVVATEWKLDTTSCVKPGTGWTKHLASWHTLSPYTGLRNS